MKFCIDKDISSSFGWILGAELFDRFAGGLYKIVRSIVVLLADFHRFSDQFRNLNSP